MYFVTLDESGSQMHEYHECFWTTSFKSVNASESTCWHMLLPSVYYVYVNGLKLKSYHADSIVFFSTNKWLFIYYIFQY